MTHQSHVADASIVKIDEEKRLVFGWASIIKDESGKILLDRQDDFIDSEEELEKAAYDYVLRSRDGGEMHVRRGVSKMVESIVFTEEKQRSLGIPVGSMPTGWWIGFKVNDDRVWEQVKKGEYMGFSVHGTGRRESTELPVSKITEIGKAETKKKKNKIATVMGEFKAGKLKSSSGQKVTDPKQAMAIAISEQKRAKMRKIDLNEIIEKTAELMKVGDKPGHPFRGNQYTRAANAGRANQLAAQGKKVTRVGFSSPSGAKGKAPKKSAGQKRAARESAERLELRSSGTQEQVTAYMDAYRGAIRGKTRWGKPVEGEHQRLNAHGKGMAAARKAGYTGMPKGGTRPKKGGPNSSPKKGKVSPKRMKQLQTEESSLMSRGTKKQIEAYRSENSGRGLITESAWAVNHKRGMAAARKAGYKG